MYSFQSKTAAATLMVGFLLANPFGATAQAGGGTSTGLTSQQQKAVRARWQAVNRYYHLGAYSPAAVARQAEERRGQALNRYYHLGKYAVVESSSPFRGADAGVGAGAMLGMILVTGGLAIAVRRRGGDKPAVPRPT